MRSILREVVETVVLVVLVMIVVNMAVDRTHVEGPSMQPTLQSGQYLLTNKLAYSSFVSRVFAVEDPNNGFDHPATPQRGDIVILRYPNDRSVNFVKRVVGLAGETIELRDGVVYVNGRGLSEPYVVNRDHYSMSPVVIGSGRVFVMGDNRPKSNDSRAFGPVGLDDIVGRAWFRYWPLAEAGLLPNAP